MTTPVRVQGETTRTTGSGAPKLRAAREAAGIRLREHFMRNEIGLDEFVRRLVQVQAAQRIDGVNVAMRRLPPVPEAARDKRASRPAATDVETVAHLFEVGHYGARMPEGRWSKPEGMPPEKWATLGIEQQAALLRAAEAARLTREAEVAEEAARLDRLRACAALHTTFKVPQAQLYKKYGITRSVFERGIRGLSSDLPTFENETLAGRAADLAHREYLRQRSMKETARTIRDAAIAQLGDQGRSDHLGPSEIAAATEMSKQLVDAARARVLGEAA